MELYSGRPINTSDRLDKEIKVYNYLDELNVDFYRTDHEAADTMEACREIEKTLEADICKNLFLCNRQQTDFYLLLMPGEKVFKTKDLSHQLEVSRLSFAPDSKMLELLNITPGSVSIFGLLFDNEKRVNLVIDRDILKPENFGCHPCINTSCIRIKTTDLFNVILPKLRPEFTFVDLPTYEEQ